MDPIATAAASGMRARLETLDMLANNLSNASTSGYKLDREFYSIFSGVEAAEGQDSRALPFITRPWTDFAQGTLTPTGNPLDLALSGKGFFAVQGPSGTLYSRNGSFQVSATGQLVTHEGYAVLGKEAKTLQLDPGKNVEIDKEGFVRQDSDVIGQLDIVNFTKPSDLTKRGESYFEFRGNAAGKVPAPETEVHQAQVESSNVSTSEAAVRIVGVMRQFEMLNRAILLSGEMNKKSLDEVARVSS